MQAYFNDLLPSIQSLGLWGYWLIGLLAFGEALILTSVFTPGTVVVVFGGALAAQGVYDFGDMIWFVAIGTTLGAEISFRIGAKGTNLFSATMTRAGLFAIAVLLVLAFLWFAVVKLRKALPFCMSIFRSIGLAIKDNPDVRTLVERHPVLFRFLSERVSRESFAGLPVTLLATALVYFLFLYAGSTLDFVGQSPIVAADVRIANLLSALRDPALVRFDL